VSGEDYIKRSVMFCILTNYHSDDQIKKNEKNGACGIYGDKRGVFRILVVKREKWRPLGRHRRTLGDNIKIDLQKVECGDMDWIDLTHDTDNWRVLVNAVMKLRVL
jgi:hypothetical protein